jgi:hypothetical protein
VKEVFSFRVGVGLEPMLEVVQQSADLVEVQGR